MTHVLLGLLAIAVINTANLYPAVMHTAASTAAVDVADESARDCHEARKLAVQGITFGTLTGKNAAGVVDNCVAAVFDPSRVLRNETAPERNEKNYRCVGKNMKISYQYFDDKAEMLIASWSTASHLPAGKCALQLCFGTNCNQAELIEGLPSTESLSILRTGAVGGFDQSSGANDSLVPEQIPLSMRINDAFTDIDAQRWGKDVSGATTVLKEGNPELMWALEDLAYSHNAMLNYEAEELPQELKSDPAYIELTQLSNKIEVRNHETPSENNPFSAGRFFLGSASTFQVDVKATAKATGRFWDGWRLSGNVEQQSIPERIAAQAEGVVFNGLGWVVRVWHTIRY